MGLCSLEVRKAPLDMLWVGGALAQEAWGWRAKHTVFTLRRQECHLLP